MGVFTLKALSLPARIGRIPVLLVLAVMIPLAAAMMGLSFRSEMEQERARVFETVVGRNALRARQLNDAVAQQMTALIHLFDMALGQMANSYLEGPEHFRVSMTSGVKAFPANTLNLVLITDAAGTVVQSSDGQGLGVSLADRPYIRVLVESGQDRLSIGDPVLSRVLGRWVIPFARPILRDGHFAGAIVLSVRPEYLNQSLQAISLNANDLIGLVTASGVIMAGNVLPMESIGSNVPADRPYLAADAPHRGAFTAPSIVDGRPLELSWMRLPNWPLIAVVGLDPEPVLAPLREAETAGRHRIYAIASGLMAVSLMLSAMLLKAEHQRRRREQEEARIAHQLSMTGALEAVLRFSLQDRPLLVILDGALEILLNQPWLNIANKAALFLAENDGTQLRMVANRNLDPSITASCGTIRLGHCLCGQAAALRKPVFKSEVDADHHIHFDGMENHGHYSIPILKENDLLGVLTVYVTAGHGRDENEARFLVMFADTLSAVISRSQLEVRRRSTEMDLRATAARLSLVLDTAAEGILGFDDQGRMMFANPAALRLLDWPSDATIQGQPITEVTGHRLSDGQTCQDRHCHMREVIAHGGTHRVTDEFFTTRSGAVIPVEYVVSPLEVAEIVVGAVVAFHDISVQKTLQAELKAINAELEQFAYVASHDLRQPLRMISSYLALIEKRLGPQLTGELGDFFHFVTGGAKRMDAMIVGLLEYSRTGRDLSAFSPQELGDIVTESLANLEVAVAEAGAEVSVATDLPMIKGDRLELTRLFQNLIGNAVKYHLPERPVHITVAWRDQGEEWVISVRDNGIGIPAEDRERVFTIFQRLVTREKYEGTGIGLAVCKKIAEHHGGRIWVESEPGEGCTFFVTFPKVLRDTPAM